MIILINIMERGIKMDLKKKIAILTATALFLVACEAEEEQDPNDTTEEIDEVDSEETEGEEEEDVEESVEEAEEELTEVDDGEEGKVEESEYGRLTIHSLVTDIEETIEDGPFEVTLLNARLAYLEPEEDYVDFFGGEEMTLITFEIEVENLEDETNSIYPDQGTIVTNTGQQIEADLLLSEDVGGEFLGEVIKIGNVQFFLDEDPEEIESVRYVIGSGHNEDFENFGEDFEFEVEF